MAEPKKIDPYALRAERKAKDKEARIAAAKLGNPPGLQNQPGSGQLTPNTYAMPAVPRAWQLPQRTASATSGPIGGANPPPVGNQASQRVTTVQLGSTARNPYDFASGRGTPEDYMRWEKANRGSIGTRTITAQEQAMAGKKPAERNYDQLFMTPAEIAERDYNQRDQENYRIEQKYGAEFSEQRRPPTTASESGAGRFPRGKAKVPEFLDPVNTGINTPHNAPWRAESQAQNGYKPVQWSEAKNPEWRTELRQKHKWVDDVNDERQKQFVAMMRQNPDPNSAMEGADAIAAQAESPQQPPALALNQSAQQPMLDVYRPLAAPSTAAATTPPGAGTPAPLSTEADAFAETQPTPAASNQTATLTGSAQSEVDAAKRAMAGPEAAKARSQALQD